MEWDNSLRRQSYSLPMLLADLFEDLDDQVKELLRHGCFDRVKRIILTGCGDSHGAGIAVRYGLMQLLKLPVEVIPTIDLSREYPVWLLTEETLVIGISVSGNGDRMEEAMDKAKVCGALTLGITKTADSGVGRLCSRLLRLNIPAFERGPGNRNYFACVLALLLFGIRLGQTLGQVSDAGAERYRQAILSQGRQLKLILPDMDARLLAISQSWRALSAFDFAGAGMDYGAAWFGHAKIIEAVGAVATHNNAEEWFHMNNFFRPISQCGTVFFMGTKSAGSDRTRQAALYAHRLGRPVLVVTDDTKEALGDGIHHVCVPASEFGPAMALTQYIPSCLLAGYIGAMLGERNCRGCLGPWEFAAGGAFISTGERIGGTAWNIERQ